MHFARVGLSLEGSVRCGQWHNNARRYFNLRLIELILTSSVVLICCQTNSQKTPEENAGEATN
jgi:hypothetical protein